MRVNNSQHYVLDRVYINVINVIIIIIIIDKNGMG